MLNINISNKRTLIIVPIPQSSSSCSWYRTGGCRTVSTVVALLFALRVTKGDVTVPNTGAFTCRIVG